LYQWWWRGVMMVVGTARHWVTNDVGVSDKRSDLRGLV